MAENGAKNTEGEKNAGRDFHKAGGSKICGLLHELAALTSAVVSFGEYWHGMRMIEELRKLIKAVPFNPFTLEVSSGRHVHVPHPDHILVTAKGVIAVEDDEGLVDIISALHLVGITTPSTSES